MAERKLTSNKMPPRDMCYFHWVTFQSVRLRTLFEVIKHIIYDAVLLFHPPADGAASISIDQYDNTKKMVIYVKLNKMDPSTFFISKEMKVGINTKDFYKTLKDVIPNDVVGMCIEKRKWDAHIMTLDIYIMNDKEMYSYFYEYKALAIEYIPVDLPLKTTFSFNITINSVNFKRYLNACATHGDYIKFKNIYHSDSQMNETVFTPVGGDMRSAKLALSLYSPGDFAGVFKEHEFCIGSLLLFAKKATTLCHNMRLLLDDTFPAVVEYDVGTLGKLRFLLAWRMVEKEPPVEMDLDEELSMIEQDLKEM